MHWTDYLITVVCVCVCVCTRACVCKQISCRTITFVVLNRFLPNIARCSEKWSGRRLLFLRQIGSTHPILEVCKFRFWQFCNCGCHAIPRIITKIRMELKLISIHFVLSKNRIWILERSNSGFGINSIRCRTTTYAFLCQSLLHLTDPNLTEHNSACFNNFWHKYHLKIRQQSWLVYFPRSPD